MRCSVARLCERTVGRRVPLLWAGGGLLHTTPHCVVVTVQGAELVSCASHTERRWFQRVRSWRDMESATLPCGRGGSGRSIPAVGNGRSRELCEALELARCKLQADHFRFFTSNHSRPIAATINTTMMLHGVGEVGSSLGVTVFASGAFFGAGGCTTGGGFGVGVV